MNRKKKFGDLLYISLYLYISLPILIFIGGWLRWQVAVPILLLSGIVLINIARDVVTQNTNLDHNLNWSNTEVRECFIGIILIAIWVVMSGIGGVVFQNSDHGCRNEIYEILVTHKWPVVQTFNSETHGEYTRQLVYYIGFWLPSAVVGKIFGIESGYIFQIIWAIIGIALTFLLICNYFKMIKAWYMLVFIFFSGLDIVGATFFNTGKDPASMGAEIFGTNMIEWWSDYQFSNFTTQLFWVFNQAIPCWVIFLLILQLKNNKNIVFILSLLPLYSTLPLVGVLPFALYVVVSKHKIEADGSDRRSIFFREMLTIDNLAGCLIGIVSFLYLWANIINHNISMESIVRYFR